MNLEPKAFTPYRVVKRRIDFPREGMFADLYVRLKRYHLDEQEQRDVKCSTHDIFLELIDFALKTKGY